MATITEQTPVVTKKRPVRKQKPRKYAASAREKLKLEQAEKLAAGRPYELVNGRMVFKMPDLLHGKIQMCIGAKLFSYFESNPIGLVASEVIHRLWPDNPYEGRLPDISVILNESLDEEERYPSRAPDIAIEIISPDDAWTEIYEKARLYLDKGSKQVWIVDPYEKGVMIVTQDDRRWTKNRLTCPELLPGLEIDVQEIFEWPVKQVE